MIVLIKERKSRGMSQAKLAQHAGCSQQLISKAERGENISISQARKIANVLGINWKDLYL